MIHVPDVLADPDYTWSEAQKIGGYRAALGVPLLRKGCVVGVIFICENSAAALYCETGRVGDHFCRSGSDRNREYALAQ